MRWIWIDRILELERARRCVAIKNITLAEDVLHDHFAPAGGRPATAVMPHTLIIEGMAQTAGILVGHARDFREKVILAKIAQARFSAAAGPGYTLRFEALLERLDDHGAATTGTVSLLDPATGRSQPLAAIKLMFSHIDRNRAGQAFPAHNFVFTEQLMDVLRQSGFASDTIGVPDTVSSPQAHR